MMIFSGLDVITNPLILADIVRELRSKNEQESKRKCVIQSAEIFRDMLRI
jgi:hypothetical protein